MFKLHWFRREHFHRNGIPSVIEVLRKLIAASSQIHEEVDTPTDQRRSGQADVTAMDASFVGWAEILVPVFIEACFSNLQRSRLKTTVRPAIEYHP